MNTCGKFFSKTVTLFCINSSEGKKKLFRAAHMKPSDGQTYNANEPFRMARLHSTLNASRLAAKSGTSTVELQPSTKSRVAQK